METGTKCGKIDMDCEVISSWKVIDVMKNSCIKSEAFVDFLRRVKMAVMVARGETPSPVCLTRDVQWQITTLWDVR